MEKGDGRGVGAYTGVNLGGMYTLLAGVCAPEYGGEAWNVELGGDGRFDGGYRLGRGESAAGAGRDALSMKFANLPSNICHLRHSSSDVNRLYFMLLRNSTSMSWTSMTEMPETSAQVLLVYVLSSRNLLPSMSATVSRRYSLPSLPLTDGFCFFRRYMKSKASNITFWATCVVESIVVTHLRKPVEGTASDTRG